MISMVKRNSCGKSLEIARMARDMLGGERLTAQLYWQERRPFLFKVMALVMNTTSSDM